MGKKKRAWQDRDHVLRYFGKTERQAKDSYLSFVSEGVEAGRRPELVGGRIASLRGRLEGPERVAEFGREGEGG